jgi:hypothetical protein
MCPETVYGRMRTFISQKKSKLFRNLQALHFLSIGEIETILKSTRGVQKKLEKRTHSLKVHVYLAM